MIRTDEALVMIGATMRPSEWAFLAAEVREAIVDAAHREALLDAERMWTGKSEAEEDSWQSRDNPEPIV